MSNLAKILIIMGTVLVIAGLLVFAFQKIPYFGKLPGDIVIKRENFQIYIPFATSILISIILSILATIIFRFILRK
ncbi:MAG: DUF2905 domain-containing protein [Actinobacteria bacterium]|nr:DUF2905 domain-containing protein [Actinomycetota bacterium]